MLHHSHAMYSLTPSTSQSVERLLWLMKLRWLALIGVSGAATFAVTGIVSGLNLYVISLAVFLGIASNLYIRWQIYKNRSIDLDGLHVGQAILDTLVLTLVLWASGGRHCPFVSFYVFPVLLAALLSGKQTFWPTTIASVCGLFWQELSTLIPYLQIGYWNPPPIWSDILSLIAVTLTIGMAAYFAARFTDTLREQMQARRVADDLLHLAFNNVSAGIELIENGQISWQNQYAQKPLGQRTQQTWSCPGSPHKNKCAHAESHSCHLNSHTLPTRCQFSIDPLAHSQVSVNPLGNPPSTIYEMMILSPTQSQHKLALYLDRTSEINYQQKLMHTERLASLGRTAQGVAHELNTPLATIQTLGRDLIDALSMANLPKTLQDDIEESAALIIEEVQRCSRITHALLGRSEANQGGDACLSHIIDRCIALVFPHQKECVHVSLTPWQEIYYPLDPMMQILLNLLQNSADASDEPVIQIKVQKIIRTQQELLQIEVIDQGGGLAVESLGIIFEPFYTTKSPGRGTGLGLYTSYALAQSLQGELSLDNNQWGGATASLILPLMIDE